MRRLAVAVVAMLTPLVARAQVEPLQAQQTVPQATQSSPRLRVFLDCHDCFPEFLRDEIHFVDFVRQAQDADVHILSSSQTTGGGGREVVLRFVGNNRFNGIDHEHRALSITGEPEDLRRQTILRTVIIGLLDYLAHAGLPTGLGVDVSTPRVPQAAEGPPADDRWNLWFFRVSTRASFNAEESNRESTWSVNVSGDRVTEQWKVSFGLRAEHRHEKFNLDEDDPLEVTRRERSANGFIARSLGPHWSVGIRGRADSSTFGNTKFSATVSPTVEFSVFPYEEYATRQLRVQYEIGVERARYNEVTLFDKLEETLGRHELSVRLEQQQPWGSLDAGIEWSQYLHDASLYRLEVDGELSFRVTRGLSFDIDGSASRIRDQISLPSRGATPEEVLLRLRELRSGYDVRVSFGVSYSFGSLFNNVVNPRFGR